MSNFTSNEEDSSRIKYMLNYSDLNHTYVSSKYYSKCEIICARHKGINDIRRTKSFKHRR